MKSKVENLKPLVAKLGGLATRCDRMKARVTPLEGARTEVIDEVKMLFKQRDNKDKNDNEDG